MKINTRQLAIMLVDIILLNISMLFAYYIRFGGEVPPEQFAMHWDILVPVLAVKLGMLYLSGLYRRVWKYLSINDLLTIVYVSVLSNTLVIAFISISGSLVPRSVYVIAAMLDILLIGGIRIAAKLRRTGGLNNLFFAGSGTRRVMIVGGGDAGAAVIEELLRNPGYGMLPVCIIDDDRSKRGKKILGVPVAGDRHAIESIARSKKIDEIFITIPSLSKREIKNILEECKKTGCTIKILPSLKEIIYEKVTISKLRNVSVEDLLGREPVVLEDMGSAEDGIRSKDSGIKSEEDGRKCGVSCKDYYKGKKVLVTGGGGSIGSELCRQIAGFDPAQIIIMDIYEHGAYFIQQEILRKHPGVDIRVFIGSVRDKDRVDEIIRLCRPDIVFHAAAHKHVPLMEANPGEAVKNNVIGTLNVIRAAHEYGVPKFVLISTDKAVNPTNVMGATKRVCEMLVQAYSRISGCCFAAVRFGNVLNSEGSVIPLFRKQIEEGGPVTVTHPDIIRYFMTIPEAAQLVLQAGIMAKGGEIFVLDMGEPVKIDRLARDLIKLSGYEPDKDISIVYTGLRPGEKLYEELLINPEKLEKTHNDKIYVEKPEEVDLEGLLEKIRALEGAVGTGPEEVKKVLFGIINSSQDLERN